jgi:ElaB/YqjD/DUF883 family membrane-anchored ribosome-binding protein
MSVQDSQAKTVSATEFDRVVAELATMKREFADLVGQVKKSALHEAGEIGAAVGSRFDHISRDTRHLVDAIEAQGSKSAKALGHQVEERPLISLLIAFGIGMVASRITAR